MIKKKIGKQYEDVVAGLDISSLIDVSFLLLIYFLVTSTLDPRESDLELTMGRPPETIGSFVPSIDPPKIQVDETGNVLWDNELLDTNDGSHDLVMLADRLRTYVEAWRVMREENEPRVELEVDDAVSGQRFIDVINCLAEVEITNVTLLNFQDGQ